MPQEPISTLTETKRTVEILDAKYKKADIPKLVSTNCKHLSSLEQDLIVNWLPEFENLFYGTIGYWQTEPMFFKFKEGAESYHGWVYPVPQVHKAILKKEAEWLVGLGLLKNSLD